MRKLNQPLLALKMEGGTTQGIHSASKTGKGKKKKMNSLLEPPEEYSLTYIHLNFSPVRLILNFRL